MARVLGGLVASAALVSALVAGCGKAQLPVTGATSMGVGQAEASAVELAKRWVLGFKDAAAAASLQRLSEKHGLKVHRVFEPLAMAVVEPKAASAGARAALLAEAGVAFVESELLPPREALKQTTELPQRSRGEADPLRPKQWHLDLMGIPKVWAAMPELKPVVVAVIDTGVDLNHPDLKAKLVPGYNAAKPGQPPQDDQGHGTATAGCVGAIMDNGQGVAGVAPNAKLMPVKVGNGASTIVDAMMWAADHADMITMSLSIKPGMADYPTALETTRRAAQYVMSKNCPMVCSMGNTGTTSKNVPAAYAGNDVPNLIAVGASDDKDRVASFSTRGTWVSVAAPGTQIMTTKMGGGYGAVDGTSFSTPITAGVVALMLGSGCPRDPKEVKARLQRTAIDIDAPGVEDKSGSGRVDALAAVQATSGGRRR